MITNTAERTRADILAIGFGTTAAMWTVGYVCRLFGDAVPAALIFVLVLAALVAGGVVVGRYTGRGALGGVYVGLLSGLVNLFIVGSLIGGRTPNEIKSGALLWIPGTLVVLTVLAVVGAAIGSVRPRRAARTPDWPGGLALVAACATFVLLAAGGLVTGFDEGLAVVDWPNTEGYNMFLYPLARMTGGVYLEHAHRLLGSLVGMTTLVLAIHVQLHGAPGCPKGPRLDGVGLRRRPGRPRRPARHGAFYAEHPRRRHGSECGSRGDSRRLRTGRFRHPGSAGRLPIARLARCGRAFRPSRRAWTASSS